MLKGLFRRWKLFGAIAFAVLTISTMAISTMAWFTIERSQTIETGLVTGSSEIDVDDDEIYGYKVVQSRKANGYVDYGTTTVTGMKVDTSDMSTANQHQDGEDLDFDIPLGGIGYYFIPQVSNNYKYSQGEKMTEFTGSNSHLAYISSKKFTASNDVTSFAYRIRQYGFDNHETVSRKVEIASAQSDNETYLTATVSSGDLLITLGTNVATVTCGVWFDYSRRTVGFEIKGHTMKNPSALSQGPKPNSLYGNENVYLKPNSNWNSAGAWFALYYYKDNSNYHWAKMQQHTGDNDCWYANINVTNYPYCIFCRMNSNDTSTLAWTNVWNQTADLTIPSGKDGNRLYVLKNGYWSKTETGEGAYWGTYGDYSRTCKMTIGGSTTTLSKSASTPSGYLEQYEKTSLAVTAGQQFSFTINDQPITVSKDSSSINLTSDLKVTTTGTIDVYLKIEDSGFPNGVLYISEPSTYSFAMTAGGSTTAMTKSAPGDTPAELSNHDVCRWQYYITGINLATATTLSFTMNGSALSVNKDGGAGNLTDSLGVVYGGKVDVYLKISQSNFPYAEVYISDVYTVTIGSTTYELSSVKENFSGHKEVYNETGVAATAGDTIASVAMNGSTIPGWGVSSSAGNNANPSTKKIIKTCSGAGAFYDTESKTLWITGNKTYTFKTYAPGSSTAATSTEMGLCESGDFAGWYTLASRSITQNYKAEVVYTTYDGDGHATHTTMSLNYASSYVVSGHTYSHNNITNADKFITTGTSDVYFDTTNRYFYVTPIYSVSVGGTRYTAALESGSATLYKATGFNINGDSDHYAVKAYANETELTTWAAYPDPGGGIRNNLQGTAGHLETICYAEDPVDVLLYTDVSQIYVTGFHDPIYQFKVSSDPSNYHSMDASATNAFGQASDTRTATINVSEGDTFTFFENRSQMGPALAGDANNVTKTGSGSSAYYIVQDSGEVTIYWDVANSQIWVSGKEYTYYFVNSTKATADSQLFSGTIYAYAFYNDTIKKSEWPGEAMSLVASTDNVYSVTINYDRPYSKMVFNDGTNKTADLTLSGRENQYYWVENDVVENGHYKNGNWYSNPPATATKKTLYFHDAYASTHFGEGANVYAYAFATGIVPMDGSVFPGSKMGEIVDTSLFKVSVSSSYTTIIFGKDKSHQTPDIPISAVSEGSVYLAASELDNDGAWGTAADISAFGTATIRISHADSTVTEQVMGTGDTSSNYFIYENGIYADKNDTFVINYQDCSYLPGGTGTLDGDDMLNNPSLHPFLDINGTTIKFNVEGRYNFYVTDEGKISVAMVPVYGNGFYIIPYASSTVGYRNSVKMNTISPTSASYTGYYASPGKSVYIRSYLNAVDVLYKNIEVLNSSDVTITDKLSINSETGVISFGTYSGYLNFEVAEGRVYIRPYSVSEFFKLNALDPAKATSTNAIKNQKTSLVLEVPFTVSTNHDLDIYLDVTNPFKTGNKYYVGCAGYVSNSKITPSQQEESDAYAIYTYMRTNCYANLSGTISGKIGTTTASGTYYAYILIDYIYDGSLDYHNLRSLTADSLSFYMRSTY